jgi:hypothetical protein
MSAQRDPSRIESEARLALAALKRARRRAERLAAATGTLLVEVHNGRVVFVEPKLDPADEDPQAAREQ